jgi:hypothetical protein
VAQNHVANANILISNGTTNLVARGVNGTVNALSVSVLVTQGASAGVAQLMLQDGRPITVWTDVINAAANAVVNPRIELSGLSMRFFNGLDLVVISSSLGGGPITANIYYSSP